LGRRQPARHTSAENRASRLGDGERGDHLLPAPSNGLQRSSVVLEQRGDQRARLDVAKLGARRGSLRAAPTRRHDPRRSIRRRFLAEGEWPATLPAVSGDGDALTGVDAPGMPDRP
jgi:hypothetical protein